MSDDYLLALWAEIGAWKALQEALREQRQAIIHRQIEALWASQDTLQDLLGQAVVRHQRRQQRRPALPPAQVLAVEQQAERQRQQAKQSLRLNHELLKDICCYLDMMREVVFPQTLPPTYADPRDKSRPSHPVGHAVSRSA